MFIVSLGNMWAEPIKWLKKWQVTASVNDKWLLEQITNDWYFLWSNQIKKYILLPIGDKDEKGRLAEEDFIIVIQTEFQREQAQKFANNGVCCDSTHGTRGV